MINLTSNQELKKPEIILHLESIAPFIPFPLYWGDVDTLRVMGANKSCLDAMGAKHPEDVIGKTPYDYYSKDIANNIIEHAKKVIELKIPLSQEDVIKDITTGKTRYFSAIRTPLLDNKGNMVAIIGTSIEITAEKECEQFQLEHAKVIAQLNGSKEFMVCLHEIQHTINNCKARILDSQIQACATSNTNLSSSRAIDLDGLKNIKLTKREREVLYFLSLNKSPKEIANILSILENKSLSPLTISSIIDKQLYIKFAVNSVSRLIEVANKLKLIPFSLI